MAFSYSQAAQRAMSEKEKRDFGKGQGGESRSHSGQMPSQSGTNSKTESAKSRTLGQKAMEFLLEKTQIKAEIKVSKEVIKGEGGKEEEVDVWEYLDEDIQSLNNLYEKHAVLFNFSGRSRELSLNEKRRWVMDRLIALEDVPGKGPEVSYHRRGRGRGHLGSSCPQGSLGETGGKRVALKQSMMQECESKPGVWYINAAQYRGWSFDDNLENPKWVWVMKGDPTVKPDIYPPYDSRWRHTGAKRMEDKETGFLIRPMLEEEVMQDVEQRLKLMRELHEVGKNAELAFLENAEVRAQQQDQIGDKEERSSEMEEGEGDNMDCEQGGKAATERGSTSTKRKGEARGEMGSNTQEGDSQQGKRRQKTQSGKGGTTEQDEGESAGTSGKESNPDSCSRDVASKGSRAGEEGTGTAGDSEEDLSDKVHPDGASQYEEDKSGSQGSQVHVTLEDEERVRERARKRGMQNVENMTLQQILQVEEDQKESSADEESEASLGEEEEEEEEDQEDSDVEDWTRDQWVKEVEQLEWGRTIECEIRLAHHKHLRNLQQVTQAGEDITSENRFELLRREGIPGGIILGYADGPRATNVTQGVIVRSAQCLYHPIWKALICGPEPYTAFIFESRDFDTETRRIGPVRFRQNDSVNIMNGMMDHGWCFSYTCQKRLSTYYTYVLTNMTLDIRTTGKDASHDSAAVMDGLTLWGGNRMGEEQTQLSKHVGGFSLMANM
ncbi:hypothetical protein CBR_g10782 [Chara braunii]|uniref:Uncharacterized protein n=1 Tax=Chara braunii TaxID=69332 RepID=A0A388KPH5_CHABU|nr:hypothetical protein CBR_g10782 [Chara braunii]|eukprot:GBG71843.1 hypothetical protein CBR_g10782 [Chara braunii]